MEINRVSENVKMLFGFSVYPWVILALYLAAFWASFRRLIGFFWAPFPLLSSFWDPKRYSTTVWYKYKKTWLSIEYFSTLFEKNIRTRDAFAYMKNNLVILNSWVIYTDLLNQWEGESSERLALGYLSQENGQFIEI